MKEPKFPLTITYNDGEIAVINYRNEDCCGLESFDSENIEDPNVVLDANDQRVRLKIDNKKYILCELMI